MVLCNLAINLPSIWYTLSWPCGFHGYRNENHHDFIIAQHFMGNISELLNFGRGWLSHHDLVWAYNRLTEHGKIFTHTHPHGQTCYSAVEGEGTSTILEGVENLTFHGSYSIIRLQNWAYISTTMSHNGLIHDWLKLSYYLFTVQQLVICNNLLIIYYWSMPAKVKHLVVCLI